MGGRAGKGGYALLNKIIQQVAESKMTIGMSKGRGEDKRWNTGFHHV